MSGKRRISWIFALGAVMALPAGGDVYDATFERGNKAYMSGNYTEAIAAYEQLVEESVNSAAVFHNLANAYYRDGQLGAAIANYERVLQLDPGFEEAAKNLHICIAQTERRLPRPHPPDWEQSLFFWHYQLTGRTSQWLAGLCWIALWILLGIRQIRPVRYMRRAALVAGVLACSFGASAWFKAHGPTHAVANADRMPVHYGTSDQETVRYELYMGDRVLVDRREAGWARVTTADGERGWSRAESLAFVGPPYERPRAK